jgi:hypothetical protein
MKANSSKVQYTAEAYSCCLRIFEYYDYIDIQGESIAWVEDQAGTSCLYSLFKWHVWYRGLYSVVHWGIRVAKSRLEDHVDNIVCCDLHNRMQEKVACGSLMWTLYLSTSFILLSAVIADSRYKQNAVRRKIILKGGFSLMQSGSTHHQNQEVLRTSWLGIAGYVLFGANVTFYKWLSCFRETAVIT